MAKPWNISSRLAVVRHMVLILKRSYHRKDLSHEMEKSYDPVCRNLLLFWSFKNQINKIRVEKNWYEWWESKGYFTPKLNSKKTFSMVLPPPNVTGSLHIGHALTVAVQDALARYKKMNGFDVLWIPGTDHAGISTQVVVEKKLLRETGKSRYDLGREAFVNEVWKWKHQYGDRITKQIRALGAMTDWSREHFTMDEKLSTSVKETFVKLYDDGLIYRDTKLVNWCPMLNTAISDIEVDHKSLTGRTKIAVPSYGNNKIDFGVIHTFNYPVINTDSPEDTQVIGYIPVSTTRIETMLGDTAVAIHPDDERYKSFQNKFIRHPFHPSRRIPIITDSELVNMEFGTGAVKITPAHDQNDFLCGKRHNLQFINIINRDGTMNADSGFPGMNRFKAREVVKNKLTELNLYVGEDENAMQVPICSRSGDVIEPLLVPQWFVKCDVLVDKVLENELVIYPESYRITWKRWLEGMHDWCISRQLWWGHRIPAYKILTEKPFDKEEWVVARDEQEAHNRAKKLFPDIVDFHLQQDEDVLDTWFSSGIYPISTLGWPDMSSIDLQNFYPLSIMETGSDILFFWVARMMMLCTYLLARPFPIVYLHAMIRDQQGRKMSKTLGNVIDPMDVIYGITLDELKRSVADNTNISLTEVKKALQNMQKEFPKGIEQCGTDALRFTLIQYTLQGRQINLDVQRIVANRHFCNKIWQATRFAMSFGKGEAVGELGFVNEWILGRLNQTIEKVTRSMEGYQFSDAANTIQSFFLHSFCDVYLELIKPVLYNRADSMRFSTLDTLLRVLESSFRLMHPFMPYITEELWQRLPLDKDVDSIMETSYPSQDSTIPDHDPLMQVILTIVQELRSIRHTLQLPPVSAYVATTLSQLEAHVSAITTLTKATAITVISPHSSEYLRLESLLHKMVVRIINAQCSVYVPLPEDISPKLQSELAKLQERLLQLSSLKEKYERILDGLKGVGENENIKNVRSNTELKLSDVETEIPKVLRAIAEMQALIHVHPGDHKNL